MPCDYSKYPASWKTEIRPRILEREGHKCKFCGVANYKEGWRFPSGNFYTAEQIAGDYMPPEDETKCDEVLIRAPFKIVLTIAHINHDTTDNTDENLAALCQRCHNRHDVNFRNNNRQNTRSKKAGLLSLF